MSDTRYIQGLDALSAALKGLPAKIATKVLRGGVLDGANIVKAAAIANAPTADRPIKRGRGQATAPGTLKANIIVKFDGPDSNATQVVYIVTARQGKGAQKYGKDAFYARFVEFGHRIVPRRSKATPGPIKFRRGQSVGAERVPPHKFLTPAINDSYTAAEDAIVNGIRTRLAKLPEFQ